MIRTDKSTQMQIADQRYAKYISYLTNRNTIGDRPDVFGVPTTYYD